MRHPLTGRRISITAPTRAEFEIRRSKIWDIRKQLRTGELDPMAAGQAIDRLERPKVQTVRELWDRYEPGVQERAKPRARANWNNRLKPYFGELALWQLDVERMRNWEVALTAADFKRKTIRGAYDLLSAMFGLAIDKGEIAAFPWKAWRPRTATAARPRESTANMGELRELLVAAREHDRGRWSRGKYADTFFAILVMTLTGMRQGECAALGWDFVQIDRPPYVLRIEFQAARDWRKRDAERPRDPPKMNRKRSQLLHDSVVEVLRAQREQLKRFGWYRKDGPVFPGRRSDWSLYGRVLKPEQLRKIVEAAGLPNSRDWVTHSLRHSFCTLEAAHSDVRSAMSRSGHTSIQSFQGYMHPAARGTVKPAIPELDAGTLPALEATGESLDHEAGRELDAVDRKSRASAALATSRALLEATADLTEGLELADSPEQRKERRRGEESKPLEQAAKEWLLDGAPTTLPLAARKAFKEAYARAYNRARREGADNEERKAAGKRARAASIGAWSQTVARARRAIGTQVGLSKALPPAPNLDESFDDDE